MGKNLVKRVSFVALGLVVAGMLTVSSADAASGGVEITNSDVTPFASKKVDNGLGVWEYGVKNKLTSKEAYSNLWHKRKLMVLQRK